MTLIKEKEPVIRQNDISALNPTSYETDSRQSVLLSDSIILFPQGQVPQISENISDRLKNRYTPKKLASQILSDKLYKLGYKNESIRVSECANYLEFSQDISSTGETSELYLSGANFCRHRLCPNCNWRRSLKVYSNLTKILSDESIMGQYKFLFVTLTIPNVPYDELAYGIDKLLEGYKVLSREKNWSKVAKGVFRALEVTVNQKTCTFHPHLHLLVAVPLSYGQKNVPYISHDYLLKLWRKCTNDESITQVDIRVIKSKDAPDPEDQSSAYQDAIKEVAKYSIKAADFENMSDACLLGLLSGLHGRRLISLSGVFRKVSQLLNLSDAELKSTDLTDTDCQLNDITVKVIYQFKWTGFGYELVDTRTKDGI